MLRHPDNKTRQDRKNKFGRQLFFAEPFVTTRASHAVPLHLDPTKELVFVFHIHVLSRLRNACCYGKRTLREHESAIDNRQQCIFPSLVEKRKLHCFASVCIVSDLSDLKSTPACVLSVQYLGSLKLKQRSGGSCASAQLVSSSKGLVRKSLIA